MITIVTIKLISEPNNTNSFGQNDVIDDKKLENSISNVNITNTESNETKSLNIDKAIQSEDNVNVNQETQPVSTETKPTESDIFGIAKNKEAVNVETPKNTTPAHEQNIAPQKTAAMTKVTANTASPTAQKLLRKKL